jgi:sugar phosphate isomerase/epimerase
LDRKYSQNRSGAALGLPFKIGAPSMVFGENLLENAYLLAGMVDHVEIVLFYTPALHNFPSPSEIKALRKLGANEDLSFSVHLPTFLEIASRNRKKREKSIQMVIDLINFMDELDPLYHILHIPYSTLTLTPVPGLYFTGEQQAKFIDWTKRATESLETIQCRIEQKNKILVENINYSPIFLESFWKLGLCGFCLDIGHLILGRESVLEVIKQFMPVIREVHLHGVKGHEEHLSLAVLPEARVSKWVKLLANSSYGGVVNLEVFSAEDLETSISMLIGLFLMVS